ncbi:DUF2861 family protein [Shewanella psychropiezotolerans]|uniref:DUF2861 family protein n=1 Tax=Shewanella psychropiezotolerans TaxID=2593655 RepID=A0ABX5WZY2_9GAMM|nr:DUF2861 family protein [Shewanella psychropiezotolerans]QDO84672.1 DUF2861 family protein [Shewanella psychropiezotolerans]
MKTIKPIFWLVSASLAFSQQVVANDWFMPTPLSRMYSALVIDKTQLAWQEMLLALSQESIDEKHWENAKQTLISQSQCGKLLLGDLSFNQQRYIRLTIQKKTNSMQQGFKLKVSLGGVEKSAAISLRDQQGQAWISGSTTEPKQGYVELESDDFVYAPTPGFYQLTIDNTIYPIILSFNYDQSWIEVNNSNADSPISIQVPKTLASCQAANMRWQWFDDKFTMLGNSQLIQLSTSNLGTEGYKNARLPEYFPNHAKWLSAVVSKSEYQGEVRIEYAQRFTFPIKIKTNE